ncbi:MAG: exo-alpha-sialidase [Akkermansiaceae bacterium]|nr:exo-alpha-sialidase [Akkermansiaceae bacterium]
MTRHLLLSALFLSWSFVRAESPVPRSILDLTLEPTEINFNPGPEYSEEQQDYAMVIGMDRTPKGRLWAAWVGGGDSPLAYFIAATSDDDGKTWSHPRMVIRPGRTVTGLNRSVIVGNFWTDPTGKLWMFYDQSLEQFDGRAGVWAITCENPDDEKPTWSAPRRIWHGMSLNKPTVLSNGDWMLPISLWDRGHIKPVFGDAYPELDDQRMAHWFASSDRGKTWTRRGGVAFPKPRFDEHMLVELKDGRLRMLARNGDGIMESYSNDKGGTWSEPVPSEIKNPSSRFFFRRLQSGNLLLVKNGPLDRKFERTHMTAYLSDDDGKTWKGGLVIDEREDVSYPDGFQAPDGRIYIIHDRERSKQREILFAKFTEADILAKDFVTEGSAGKIPVFKGRGARKGAYLPNNGIQLAEQWPPKDLDPKSAEPMPVPYLEKKNIPAVIPINIGRQLFVDDFLIESTDLTRTFHAAEKLGTNPVFKPETKQELEPTGIEGQDQAVTYLGHGGVFYNPAKSHFEMFYTASWRGGLALATSPDLIHWTRPQLGLSGDNIILPAGADFAGKDNAIWLDLDAKDPSQRYKAIIQRGKGHTLHTSPDGLVWSSGIPAGDSGDYSSFFHNPFRNVWVQSIKRNTDRGRARYYHESRDFTGSAARDKSVYWTNADKLDPPDPAINNAPQLYSLNAVAYESILLGEHYVLLGPTNRVCEEGKFPKITELHLGFSRDGFHWSRPDDRRPFIAASRRDGQHDRAYLHGTNGVMLVHDDKLWFPYCGYSGIAPNGHRGMYTGASIGMATLRRDGFASMDATGKSGTLTTRPVAFNGRHLFVNVSNPGGKLRVEILDEKGKPIAPFTTENCVTIKADSTLHEVTWKGTENLDGIRGKSVRFRFHLTDGSLYSFWVSQDEKGASGGYLGGGGSAYGGIIDTKGKDALK